MNETARLDGCNIVLIDDEPAITQINTHYLELCGARVVTFSCGEDALRYIDQQPENVEVVITDYHMSDGINGGDVCHHISVNHPRIACLVLTGFIADNFEQLDKHDVIKKPVQYSHLVKKIIQARKNSVKSS